MGRRRAQLGEDLHDIRRCRLPRIATTKSVLQTGIMMGMDLGHARREPLRVIPNHRVTLIKDASATRKIN